MKNNPREIEQKPPLIACPTCGHSTYGTWHDGKYYANCEDCLTGQFRSPLLKKTMKILQEEFKENE